MQPVVVLRLFGVTTEFNAALRNRQQVTTEVAAVHGGHVHGQQRQGGGGVVPIEQMASVALQPLKCVHCVFQPFEHLLRRDPSKSTGAGGAQQVQAHVGGRSSARQHVVRLGLKIVWRQVVVGGGDGEFKVAPGATRHSQQLRTPVGRQLHITNTFGRRPTDPPNAHWRNTPQRAQDERPVRMCRMRREQDHPQQQGRDRHPSMQPPLARQRGGCLRLRSGGRGPLQQVAATDHRAVHRPRDRIQAGARLLQQLAEAP